MTEEPSCVRSSRGLSDEVPLGSESLFACLEKASSLPVFCVHVGQVDVLLEVCFVRSGNAEEQERPCVAGGDGVSVTTTRRLAAWKVLGSRQRQCQRENVTEMLKNPALPLGWHSGHSKSSCRMSLCKVWCQAVSPENVLRPGTAISCKCLDLRPHIPGPLPGLQEMLGENSRLNHFLLLEISTSTFFENYSLRDSVNANRWPN